MSWADTDEWRSYVSVLRRAAAERREEARKRYAKGESILEIALDLGVAFSTVQGYVKGMPGRKRGPKPRFGHGSPARARRHWREGEKPCAACLAAHRNQAYVYRNPSGGGRFASGTASVMGRPDQARTQRGQVPAAMEQAAG